MRVSKTSHRLGCGAAILLWVSSAQAQVLPKVDFVWRGGEQVPGELVQAGPEGVVFHPIGQSVFASPIRIALQRVDELRVVESGTERQEPFLVRLRDGGRLLADRIRLTGETFSLESAWLGAFQLKRSAVAEVTRVRGEAVVFVAPGPGVQWSESLKLESGSSGGGGADPFMEDGQPLKVRRVQGGRGRRNPDGSPADGGDLQLWRALPTGGLQTESWNNTLSAPLRDASLPVLPLRLRLDFHLSSKQRPVFVLKIEQDDTDVRVETWQERLVLRQGSRFAVVPAEAVVDDFRFTLLWNRENHETQLLTQDGQLLAQLGAMKADDPWIHHTLTRLAPKAQAGMVQRPPVPTFSLENLGADLTLHAASLTLWKGGTVEAAPAAQSYARLLGGQVLKGEWVRADESGITLRTEAGLEQSAGWDEVLAIVSGDRSPLPPPVGGPLVQIRSAAEEALMATFVGIEPEAVGPGSLQVRLRSTAAEGEWRAQWAATAQLRFVAEPDQAEPPAGEQPLQDRLTIGDHTLRGDLVAAGEVMPRWWFDGAAEPVPLDSAMKGVLRRAPRAGAEAVGPTAAALLQLKAGDLVPVTLKQVNAESILFNTPSLQRTTLAAADVAAVLFPGSPLITQGFRDPAWQQLAGEQPLLNLEQLDEVTLQPGDVLGHPAMMEGDAIELTLHENAELSPSSLNLTLYTRGLESREDSLRVVIAFVGDELYCGEGLAEGQLRRQGQMPKPSAPVRVQLLLREGQVSVRINGGEVVSIPIQASQRLGLGLLMQAGALWGNQPQAIRVSGFSAVSPSQNLRVPQIDDEVRSQALTIPRARSEEPPQHLLIAPNGDVLRGTVEQIDAGHLHLRWGLEKLVVPQARVAALVMLQPPVGEGQPAPTTGSDRTAFHWLLLRDGGRFGLTLERWAEDGAVGKHPLLGRVRVPVESVLALWSGQLPPTLDATRAVSGWVLQNAAKPVIPQEAAPVSPLVGTEAKPFVLPLLNGEKFVLQEQRGKVVVLDFWATWCGPCLKALPELMEALKDLPSDQVKLVGVNQAEQAEVVERFLKNRNWNLLTALDSDQAVGRQLGVESIPHTVVIGPDGKIALVKTGYTAEAADEIKDKVRELLGTQ
jgi:thiol-disulfide isomerase/thioredoxin